MGERTIGEQSLPIPVRARPMQFSQTIMDVVIPTNFITPIITFTYTENLETHITAFHTQMMIFEGTDTMHCKLFMGTFEGTTLEWFIGLLDGHNLIRSVFCIVQGAVHSQTCTLQAEKHQIGRKRKETCPVDTSLKWITRNWSPSQTWLTSWSSPPKCDMNLGPSRSTWCKFHMYCIVFIYIYSLYIYKI